MDNTMRTLPPEPAFLPRQAGHGESYRLPDLNNLLTVLTAIRMVLRKTCRHPDRGLLRPKIDAAAPCFLREFRVKKPLHTTHHLYPKIY